MKMAVYIMQILSTKPNVVMSWGVCKFRALQGDEGVMFHTQGFKWNGWVKVVFDQGADLFNIFYIDNKGETQKIQKGIYFMKWLTLSTMKLKRQQTMRRD